MPPDVRKGSAFPMRLYESQRGYASRRRHSLRNLAPLTESIGFTHIGAAQPQLKIALTHPGRD